MVRALVLRGAASGAIAGLLAFVFARIVAEPLISAAIDYEGARDEASAALAGQVPEEGTDLVSRGIQSTVGLGVGTVLLGAAFGLVLALAFAMASGRVGALRPRTLAVLLAGGGLGTLYLVPFLKYPANPPSVGHEDTIGDRTGLYLVMVVASVVVAVLAVVLGRRLAPRLGGWNATVAAGAAFAVVMVIVGSILPSLGELAANVVDYGQHATETPQPLTDAAGRIAFPGFDPDLLYDFRLASVITQVILWGALGVIFAPLAEKVVAPTPATGPTPVSPTSPDPAGVA